MGCTLLLPCQQGTLRSVARMHAPAALRAASGAAAHFPRPHMELSRTAMVYRCCLLLLKQARVACMYVVNFVIVGSAASRVPWRHAMRAVGGVGSRDRHGSG